MDCKQVMLTRLTREHTQRGFRFQTQRWLMHRDLENRHKDGTTINSSALVWAIQSSSKIQFPHSTLGLGHNHLHHRPVDPSLSSHVLESIELQLRKNFGILYRAYLNDGVSNILNR